ncbi:MAG: response regulator [Melioribacteraceae bacterium]|nr:response regulator [Melioribacteraceae bacterium]
MTKVLFIVHDEQIKNVIINCYSSLKGVEFSITDDFEQAEAFINSNDVSILFCQYTSKFDGFNFIKRIQLTKPNIYRILISDDSTKSKILSVINHVHKVLRLPFKCDELLNSTKYYIQLASADISPEIINKINGMGTVPVLPDIYLRLERELLKSEVSISRVADIIGLDSYITGQIMRVVFSSFYNISSNTLSVLHAINFLGLDIVKSLVLYFKVFTIKNVKPHTAEHLKKLRAHSIKVAKLSKAIMNFESQNRELHDAAFTAGLLHDIGKVVLIHFNDKHLVANDFDDSANFNLIQNEEDYFGVNHIKVGTYLLNLWNFPQELVIAVAKHHDKNILNKKSFDISQAVYIANSLVNNINDNVKYIVEEFGEEKFNYWKELVPNGEVTHQSN